LLSALLVDTDVPSHRGCVTEGRGRELGSRPATDSPDGRAGAVGLPGSRAAWHKETIATD